MRRGQVVFAAITAGLVVLATAFLVSRGSPDPGGPGRAEPRGAAEELEEQQERTEERVEALEVARAEGTLGVIARIRRAPAPGWAGERIVNRTGDDWEPAIATDPNDPYVYVLHIASAANPHAPATARTRR